MKKIIVPVDFSDHSNYALEAASICKFMRDIINDHKNASLNTVDAYNFLPLINNYIFAHISYKEIKNTKSLPMDLVGENLFNHAGIFLKVTNHY